MADRFAYTTICSNLASILLSKHCLDNLKSNLREDKKWYIPSHSIMTAGYLMSNSGEKAFQNDILQALLANGWKPGKSAAYDRERALYPEDLLGFVQESQPEQWAKFVKLNPKDPDTAFLNAVEKQLTKAAPNATHKDLRRYGTLGVLRNELKLPGARFRLCQFMPDHTLNDTTLNRYQQNRLRVVDELVYSPHGYKGRFDFGLFINGIPVATIEMKSVFKQPLDYALRQYQQDRPPIDPKTKKPEPLLTFKRGALVHFVVHQYEVKMTTRLQGANTYFLPFNQGTQDGGAGNDVPENGDYTTAYLWQEILLPANFLKIIGRYLHLKVEDAEDWQGRRYTKESMIFPRYHQWKVVERLTHEARTHGAGQRYLIQHSAGSGKSNSIAWVAHQLATLYDAKGDKQFQSVIVVTDRTVLDDQLQDTIYQFEHAEGVVGRINRKEGQGSKSAKLADALETTQPIIIVTIQTFPFVLDEIRSRATLKTRRYAIIADEAHSSQTQGTAHKLREVLLSEALEEDNTLSTEDVMNLSLEARYGIENLSYFAFTATPKPKTLEIFGTCPKPDEPASDDNKPAAFDTYTMRQAIEEGFILDVLKNYTNYDNAQKLAHLQANDPDEVDKKQAMKEGREWVNLHPTNITQKVKVIVEHFKTNVMHLLDGQAKAMLVTSSRKSAVRFKLAFDRYVQAKGYDKLHAMVAFSGEVNDPPSGDQAFTEINMNPLLRGRDMREAFDKADYQVMIVANKFQTGFDQPKLCAMYVDKKLGDIDCVQTLSRLNRTYPGKRAENVYVLDFVNDPEDILTAFRQYYKTAELAGVSDPKVVTELFSKLRHDNSLIRWSEVETFVVAWCDRTEKGSKKLSNACKPAVERWLAQYRSARAARAAQKEAENVLKHAKASGNSVLIGNAERSVKQCRLETSRLENFKSNLGKYVRAYEFLSQIIDYDDMELEKFMLYARHLQNLLTLDNADREVIDWTDVAMSHYRLSEISRQHLNLADDKGDYDVKLRPMTDSGSAGVRDKETELLTETVERLNLMFGAGKLSDKDLLNYANAIKDKLLENERIMDQVRNNPADRVMLGDFPKAVDAAVIEAGNVHQEMMMTYLKNPATREQFMRFLLDGMV
jgi:type I restriction enzyme R subunit